MLDSLRIGDHLLLSRRRLRGVSGLLVLHAAAVLNLVTRLPPRSSSAVQGAVHLVVHNPVRHGALLAAAVVSAARERGVLTRVVADPRLADTGLAVDLPFPSLALRSMGTVSSVRGLRAGWARLGQVRRRGSWPTELHTVPLPYRTYLLMAQSMRYGHAMAWSCPARPTVTDFDRAAYARPLMWAARAHGGATATLVHGTPTEANFLPLRSDGVLVWGEVQARFFAERSSGAGVTVVGRPDLSALAAGTPRPGRLILCHSMEDLTVTEVERFSVLVGRARACGMPVVLRPHPRDPDVRHGAGWPQVRALVDATAADGRRLVDVLRPDDVVVVATSTAAVDAVAVGVQAAVVADPERRVSCDLDALRELTLQSMQQPPVVGQVLPARLVEPGAVVGIVAAIGAEARALLGEALERLATGSAR